MHTEAPPQQLLTIREAAALARCSESTIRRAISAGHLRAVHATSETQVTEPGIADSRGHDAAPGEPPLPQPMLTVREVAAMAGCSTSTVYRAMKAGELISLPRTFVHVSAGELWSWMVAREEGTAAQPVTAPLVH